MNIIGSPEIVTALALAGRLSFNPLTDTLTGADGQPFRLEPPQPAPDVPAENFARGASSYEDPPEDGSDIELTVAPDSERIQLLQPWPAWDGNDLLDMPVLVKAKGKTTTDSISPAGVWLRFRGHLDRFSDNMFMGAINAYDDVAGKGKNVVTGEEDAGFSRIARDYKAQGIKWVVVGDFNYGEGSSREHAALSPRLLGGAAVIVRSFARIHESNLKKQGPPGPNLPQPGRLRPDTGRRSHQPGGSARPGLRQAGGVHHQPRRRDQRNAATEPFLRRVANSLVPAGFGAELVPPVGGNGKGR